MYQVKIWIRARTIGGSDLIEESITSEKSLRSAKNRATRWIKSSFFADDIESLTKDFETYRRADWTLTIKNPWR